jgi:hypothetical protein
MARDRSRRDGVSKEAQRERENVSIDREAEEALRALVRILAREAARELFERSCLIVGGESAPEDEQ